MSDGFFKRGKVWWFRTDPITGKQASSGKRDIESARLEYRERSRRASNPEYQSEAQEDSGLNHWAVKFVEHKRATKSAATASFYAKKLGHIVRIFGAATPIDNALRPSNFDRYFVQRKEEGARSTTISKEIRSAQTLARFAARAGAYHGRPELFRPSELSDDYEPGERFLTPEELVLLLPELAPKRAADVCLRIAIGSRYSEAYRVQPGDVDTERWLVHVRGSKTKKARATIPIAEPFRNLLTAALPYLPLEPWHNSNMVRDLAKACKRAGVTRVTANDLRRTHGSWLSQAGVGDEHIGKVLRHADGRMARRVYAKLPAEQLGRLIDATIVTTEGAEDEGISTRGLRRIRGLRGVEELRGATNAEMARATGENPGSVASRNSGRDWLTENERAARACHFWEDPPAAGATITQQLPARGESAAADSSTIPDESTEVDMRIENPRVGGSIPSRDTEETTRFPVDTTGEEVRGVSPSDAKDRSVRNENATAPSVTVRGVTYYADPNAPRGGPDLHLDAAQSLYWLGGGR